MGRSRPAAAIRELIEIEVVGALVLVAAAAAALAWANVGRPDEYEAFWHSTLRVGAGGTALELDLRGWVNDLAMALFFFVVGLEIKRELVEGDLRDLRRAALPAVAAFGGMLAPALIYLAFNPGGPAARGWGIPMATDIAFAVGVVALAGRGLPAGLRVFLLSLAIIDDIGAIVTIAIFYTTSLELAALAAASAAIAVFWAAWRWRITLQAPILLLAAAVAWLAVHESGVHATIAGVALGLAVPAHRHQGSSAALRLGHALHPWSALLVVPLFALANAGVTLPIDRIAATATHPVTLGVFLGLVVGKPVGICLLSYVATRAGLALLPPRVSWLQLTGAAAVAGIGFTVSLFIGELAFDDPLLQDAAKVAILGGSLAAAALGGLVLGLARSLGPGGRFRRAERPS